MSVNPPTYMKIESVCVSSSDDAETDTLLYKINLYSNERKLKTAFFFSSKIKPRMNARRSADDPFTHVGAVRRGAGGCRCFVDRRRASVGMIHFLFGRSDVIVAA